MPPGAGQAIVTTTFADARKAYDANGRLIQTPSYRKFETRVYVEHGLFDWLTIVAEGGYMNFRGAAAPYDHLNLLVEEAKAGLPLSLQGPPGARYEGLGLGALGARTLLFTWGDYIVSLQAGVRAASPAARRFLDMRDPVQADLRLLVGRPFELFGFPGLCRRAAGLSVARTEWRRDSRRPHRRPAPPAPDPASRTKLLRLCAERRPGGRRRRAEISAERGLRRDRVAFVADRRDRRDRGRQLARRARSDQRILVAILVGDRLDFDLGDASRSESEAVSRRD